MNVFKCLALLPVLLLLACPAAFAANPAAPEQSAKPQKKPPSFHYAFAHFFLPQALHDVPQIGVELAHVNGRPNLVFEIWEFFRKDHPELTDGADSTGLAIEGGRLTENTMLAVITMPPPLKSPDAYSICVLTTVLIDGDGMAHAQSIDYYTLEKGIELNLPSDGKLPADKPKTPPTVLGGWDKEHRHSNYGPGPAPGSRSDFVAAVLRLHAGKKR